MKTFPSTWYAIVAGIGLPRLIHLPDTFVLPSSLTFQHSACGVLVDVSSAFNNVVHNII